jgi:hypothetical protein
MRRFVTKAVAAAFSIGLTLSPVLGKASVSSLFFGRARVARSAEAAGVPAQANPVVAPRSSENPPFPVLGPGPRCLFEERLSESPAPPALVAETSVLPVPFSPERADVARVLALRRGALEAEILPRAPPSPPLLEL